MQTMIEIASDLSSFHLIELVLLMESWEPFSLFFYLFELRWLLLLLLHSVGWATSHFEMVRIDFVMFCLENSIIPIIHWKWNQLHILTNFVLDWQKEIEFHWNACNQNYGMKLGSPGPGYPSIFSHHFEFNWRCLHVLRMKLFFLFIYRNTINNDRANVNDQPIRFDNNGITWTAIKIWIGKIEGKTNTA